MHPSQILAAASLMSLCAFYCASAALQNWRALEEPQAVAEAGDPESARAPFAVREPARRPSPADAPAAVDAPTRAAPEFEQFLLQTQSEALSH